MLKEGFEKSEKDIKVIEKLEKEYKLSYYFELALIVAQRSKCIKKQFGSVIVKDDRVISTGYNGHPRGTAKDGICLRSDTPHGTDTHKGFCCHSEVNSLLFSSYHERQGGSIFVTGNPCVYCMRYLIQSGLTNIFTLDDKHYGGCYLFKELNPVGMKLVVVNRGVLGMAEMG